MDSSPCMQLCIHHKEERNRRKPFSQRHHKYLILTAFPIAFQLPSKIFTFYTYLSTIIWHKKSLPHFCSFLWTITGYFVVWPFKITTELGFCHPWKVHPLSIDYTGCVLTLGKEDDSYQPTLSPNFKGLSSRSST